MTRPLHRPFRRLFSAALRAAVDIDRHVLLIRRAIDYLLSLLWRFISISHIPSLCIAILLQLAFSSSFDWEYEAPHFRS
jgi:hypothetical protein